MGNLHRKYGAYLKKKGYRVQVADFTHPERSMHYNPMVSVRSTQDILKLTTILIDADEGFKADPYWDKSAEILLSAIMGYMVETKYTPCDFRSVLELLRAKNPDSWACAQFENANAAPYKTFDCTRTTISSKFSQFDSEELREMMCGNDVRTAQAVSERWDKPLGKVLNMPVGHCLVFRRGSQPVYTVLNNPRQYIQEMEKVC